MAYKSKHSGAEIDNTIDKVDNLDTKFNAFSSTTVNEITRLDTSLNSNTLRKTMITVGENDTTVKTFLNSITTNFYDNTHGTMVYAGGIPTGQTLLPLRVQSANTKIYEDGYLETKTGKIGNFKMDNLTLTESSQGKVKIASTTVGLSYNAKDIARFVLESSPSQDIPYLEVNKNHIFTNSSYYNESTAAKISNIPNPSTGDSFTYTALEVDARDVAIKATHGQFAGLRPALMKHLDIYKTYLTELDHTIISVFGSGDRYLYLPKNPENGQYYRIIKYGQHVLHVDSQETSRKVTRIGVSTAIGHAFENANIGTIEVTYCAALSEWILTYTPSV